MKRTTILVDEGLLVEARQLAAQQGITFTAVVQEALRAYISAHRPRRRISFMAMGCSGHPPLDLRDGRDEKILAAEIDPIDGWAPRLRISASCGHGIVQRLRLCCEWRLARACPCLPARLLSPASLLQWKAGRWPMDEVNYRIRGENRDQRRAAERMKQVVHPPLLYRGHRAGRKADEHRLAQIVKRVRKKGA